MEGHRIDCGTGMMAESHRSRLPGHVPKADEAVVVGSCQALPIGEENHRFGVIVSAQEETLLTSTQVPDAHRQVAVGRGKAPPVWAKGQPINAIGVTEEVAEYLARVRIPDL